MCSAICFFFLTINPGCLSLPAYRDLPHMGNSLFWNLCDSLSVSFRPASLPPGVRHCLTSWGVLQREVLEEARRAGGVRGRLGYADEVGGVHMLPRVAAGGRAGSPRIQSEATYGTCFTDRSGAWSPAVPGAGHAPAGAKRG